MTDGDIAPARLSRAAAPRPAGTGAEIAAIRGAVNGLMAEVMEAHIREEFGQPATTDRQRAARVREMTALVRSYLK